MKTEISNAVREKFDHWIKNAKEHECALLKNMSKDEVEDAFYKDLEFGTAGLRGLMGLGTNRINIYTVIKVSQGIADWLAQNKSTKKRICISYDNRNNSKDYARMAARVFALSGIESVLSKQLAPTPYLSYITRKFKADAGVMITASHNGKEYNGYKVYGSDGCQLTDIDASKLKGFIDNVDAFKIKPSSFFCCVLSGKIKLRSLKNDYLNQIKLFLDEIFLEKDTDATVGAKPNDAQLKVTYTALNGTGGTYVPEILNFIGIKPFLVKEQTVSNGDFATCPIPNPESDSAFALSLKEAEKNGSDIILATDPDADRAGVMVKSNGGYVRLTGNETGALLADFLLRKIKKSNPLIIRTVVTTPLVDKIAVKHGARVQKVLTGFKYIGEYVSKMEKEGKRDEFLLGLEDSAGYLASDYACDKDGVLASALICLMASEYKQSNKTLLDGLNDLHNEFGLHINKTVSYKFIGADGNKRIFDLMDSLRNGGGILPDIKEKIDFMNPNNSVTKDNDLPLTNMVGLIYDNYTLYVRPSGTEPLIKVYIMTENSAAPLNQILNACNKFFA